MTETRNKSGNKKGSLSNAWAGVASKPTAIPQIDFEKYIEELDDCELSDEEARQCLEELYKVLVGIVDLKLGLSTAHIVCGKTEDDHNPASYSPRSVVKSKTISNPTKPTHAGATISADRSHR